MRPHSHLRILATAATLAAVIAPTAHAEAISDGGGNGPVTNQHIAPASHHPASTDWTMIAVAGGGTVALLGIGLGGSRRRNRRHASTHEARAPQVA